LKLNQLIGLSKEKSRAITQIRGCRSSDLLFPHTLMYGIGGTGKTAFIRAIGEELGYHFVEVEGSVFKTREQLLSFLLEHNLSANRQKKTLLLFIDEIHRLKLQVQEALYIPMKEWRITSCSGDIKLSPFVLMGATTRFDMLDSNSFITRFGNLWEVERYSEDDIGLIVAQEFRRKGLRFSGEVVVAVAKRCLGIPRNAINFVQKLQFVAQGGVISLSDVNRMFNLEEIDKTGLHPMHRRYLYILYKSQHDGNFAPLGVGAIASKMRQPEDMIKGAVEPILLELDLISSTPRGRILTEDGHIFLQKSI